MIVVFLSFDIPQNQFKLNNINIKTHNIGTQGVQELFFCEVSEIGAFMELFTVMICVTRAHAQLPHSPLT